MQYLGARGTLIHEKQTEVENLVSDSLSYTHPAPFPLHLQVNTHRARNLQVSGIFLWFGSDLSVLEKKINKSFHSIPFYL